MLVADL